MPLVGLVELDRRALGDRLGDRARGTTSLVALPATVYASASVASISGLSLYAQT